MSQDFHRAREAAVGHLQSLIFVHDFAEDKITFLNDHVKQLLSRNSAEPVSIATFKGWIHPKDLFKFEGLLSDLPVFELNERIEVQFRVLAPNEEVRWLQGFYTVIEKESGGAPRQALAVLSDNTEKHLLFDSLERKAFELEATLAGLPDAFLRLNAKSEVIRCYHGPKVRFFSNCDAMIGKPLSEGLDPERFGLIRGLVESARELRRPLSHEFLFTLHPEKSFELRVIPFLHDEQMLIFRDLTDKARAEKEALEQRSRIVETAKMAALGQMAAGIAHEINTPLAVIVLTAETLAEELAGSQLENREALTEMADRIKSTCDRVASIVTSLRTFARNEKQANLSTVPVGALVCDVFPLCRERFHLGGVRLDLPSVPESLQVMTRPSEAGQILLNLLNNSFDAIQTLPEKWIRIELEEGPDSVRIAVRDSGKGVPEHARKRLFELFFTTKGVGKGTGLGLGISRRLAESHGGSLDLDIESPNTRFVLTLKKANA